MSNSLKTDLPELEKKVASIVRSAGKIALSKWKEIKEIKLKDKRDVVTNIDIELEERIRAGIRTLLPGAGFIVEEGISEEKTDFNWTIDPIDGTKNYAKLYPQFFIQVALLDNDNPILGVVYNPVSDQLFSATKGSGAKLNNEKLIVEQNSSLDSSIIDIDFGGNDQIVAWKLNILGKLIKNVYRVRMTGGFGNTYMLTGAFDATIYLHQQKKAKYIVDNAPRIILLEEAGFSTRLLEYEADKKVFIASSPHLTSRILELLKD